MNFITRVFILPFAFCVAGLKVNYAPSNGLVERAVSFDVPFSIVLNLRTTYFEAST
jgi:hypothetical protein